MPSNNGDTSKMPNCRDGLRDVTEGGLNSMELPSTMLRNIRESRENPPPVMKPPRPMRY